MIQYDYFLALITCIHSVFTFPNPWSFQMDLRYLRCLSFCIDCCLILGSGECCIKTTGPNRINISYEWNISAITDPRDKLLKADALQIYTEHVRRLKSSPTTHTKLIMLMLYTIVRHIVRQRIRRRYGVVRHVI